MITWRIGPQFFTSAALMTMNIFNKRNIILSITIVAIVIFVVLLGQYLVLLQKEKISQDTIKTYQHNEKILNFTKLFVKNVLKSDGAVPLSQVLTLENAAREINNKPIYDEWQKFVNAKSPLEAQIEVKNLLEMLVDRINY